MAAFGDATSGLTGIVRSYNGSKGFGFITGQGAFADVMFSRHELPEDAREVRGKFIENRAVMFDAIIKDDGRAKAMSVSILPVDGMPYSGIVSSYGDNIGFVSSHSLPGQEVFFQKADFGQLGDGANLVGQLVIFDLQVEADGRQKCSKIQFQTAKIAEKFKNSASGGMMGMMRTPMSAVPRDMGQMAQMPGASMAHLMAVQQAQLAQHKRPLLAPGSQTASGSQPDKRFKTDVPTKTTGEFMDGVIKSYSSAKRWGLISTPGIASGGSGKVGDVFFMMSNLPVEARELQLAGRAVSYELTQTQDGKYRAENICFV